jgi:hypothetical protein
MGVLAQAKNDDQQFWKGKFHATNEKAQHALKVPFFKFYFFFIFFFGWGRAGGRIFFILPLFPTCSFQVPSGFPLGSQYVP